MPAPRPRGAASRCRRPTRSSQLFSESAGRALVTVPPDDLDRLAAVAAEHGVPLTRLGEVTADAALAVEDVLTVPLAELREAHEATLPRLFD